MRHTNQYWMQALPASFFMSFIGPIFLPEWVAFGSIILMGLTAIVTSGIAFFAETFTSPLPLSGVAEGIGILVGMLISMIGIHLLFGPEVTDVIYCIGDFVFENPSLMFVFIGTIVGTILAFKYD